MVATIDTQEFADRFEEAGFEYPQARARASARSLAHNAGREALLTRRYLDLRVAESASRVLKAIAALGQSLRKGQADIDVRLTRQIGETGNNVMGKLWLAVVAVGGPATAVSTAATLRLK